MTPVTVVAIDLGASSGRVMLARVGAGRTELEEVHRFGNQPVHRSEVDPQGTLRQTLRWDLHRIRQEILTGLRVAAGRLRSGERIASIGIDAWAVDYALISADGTMPDQPFCYRDDRTTRPGGGVERVHAVAPHAELYARNGLQHLPFNTVYQLAAESPDRLAAASTLLLIPDLIAFWLTGVARAEVTNASTTGLLDIRTGEWDLDLADRLQLPTRLLPPLVHPGDLIGTLLLPVAEATGLPAGTPVTAVGSHDTASAVAAVPATDQQFAYISSGTWSLVGLELDRPVLTEQSRAANFTNESGVDSRVRYLRNVTGLWLLSETLRTWDPLTPGSGLDELLHAAALLPDGGPVFDPDDSSFLPPGDMPSRIADVLRGSGRPLPADRPALARCILDSLAAASARSVQAAARLAGRPVSAVHIVGGGSRNTLLCRLTAAATGTPVWAGPVEATAIGNALVQARALGAVDGGLNALRALVRAGGIERYDPDYCTTSTAGDGAGRTR